MKYRDSAQLDPSQMGGWPERWQRRQDRAGGRCRAGGPGPRPVAGLEPERHSGRLPRHPGRAGIVERLDPVRPVPAGFRHRQGSRLPVRGLHQLDPGLLVDGAAGLPGDRGQAVHRPREHGLWYRHFRGRPVLLPGDTTVYLDLGFFDQLETELGAKGGDAAEAYVFAHEFGHHIQNLTGTMRQVQSQGQTDRAEVAGRTTGTAGRLLRRGLVLPGHQDPNSPSPRSAGRSRTRLDAAAAVGDDRIQERTHGQVTPESWTHGSAASRQKWLLRVSGPATRTRATRSRRDAL